MRALVPVASFVLFSANLALAQVRETINVNLIEVPVTVIVLNIQIPEGGGEPELVAKLFGLVPKFLAYVTSFLMLGVLWIGHHFQSKRRDRVQLNVCRDRVNVFVGARTR